MLSEQPTSQNPDQPELAEHILKPAKRAGGNSHFRSNVLAFAALIIVVLIVVFYAYVARQSNIPTVTLSAPTKGGNASNYTVTITVTAASGLNKYITTFEGQVRMDGVPLSLPRELELGRPVMFGPSVALIIADGYGGRELTVGDSFLFYGMTGAHNWEFELGQWDGDGRWVTVTSASWVTP